MDLKLEYLLDPIKAYKEDLKRRNRDHKKRYKYNSLKGYLLRKIKRIKGYDKESNLDAEWAREQAKDLTCRRMNIQLTHTQGYKVPTNASIHRLDNDRPHTKENCIVVCYWYNQAVAIFKKDSDGVEFLWSIGLTIKGGSGEGE